MHPERSHLSGPMFRSFSFINISEGREELDNDGSRKNMVEVAVIMGIVQKLYKAWKVAREKLTIGIISAYTAQVAAIKEKIRKRYDRFHGFALTVKPVDGFQGSEEDIVIISTVRSNNNGLVGFLSNLQLANVASARARQCLWNLGDDKTLSNSGTSWEELVRDAKHRHCFLNAEEDKDLAKAILQVKEELHQLDDLLNKDSILWKSARWKIIFSDNFKKSFEKLKSSQTQKFVFALLLKISTGWRPKRSMVESTCESSLQIVKQLKAGDVYIISTVDIANHSQVLKIWDILPLEEIPELLKRLDSIFSMYTDDFLSRCKLKLIHLSLITYTSSIYHLFDQFLYMINCILHRDLEVPMTWGAGVHLLKYKETNSTELLRGSSCVSDYAEESKVKDSLLLMKFYALSSGVVSHLLSGRDGRELELPFEVTDQELETILFPRSAFILGRSGTGKTTVLTMKVIRMEQQNYFSSEGFCEVQSDFSICAPKMKSMTDDLGETKPPFLRQIFVTVSPKLCSAVKDQISNLKSIIYEGKSPVDNNSIVMHDLDNTTEFRDVPDQFTDIQPESYPLVITFQKFLMMLDGSMEDSYFDRFNDFNELSQGRARTSRTFSLHAFIRTKEVNYDRFSSLYWPHFNSKLTKNLDPSTVFIEIISHIKGGLVAGRVPEGILSREDYVVLSEGRVSTLSREVREIIYDIFLLYEKEKKLVKGEFDLGDLVIDLHLRLRNGIYEGEKMDFVYIDEVQDLTMRQIALLKYICRNFVEGFVFSGDTAQTVARGIDFRFQDITSLFYNEFLLQSGRVGMGKAKDQDQSRVTDIFQLNQNFRKHAGVLKLSQSILELIYHFFPLSIDILSPETSLVNGEAPVLLGSGDDRNAILTLFGNSGNMIGFGAEQVILVRDDSLKEEVAHHIGKQALVLTIVECKGLEFQDVLLYNFFGTSPLKNRWRVVYGYMKEHNLLDSREHESFPSFSMEKDKLLCSELKQLYVAITRTRQRLWIFENMEEISNPIFDYWKKLQVVQLFNEGNFDMAKMCFERAGDPYKEKWAKAAGLRAAAHRMFGSNFVLSHNNLIQAAQIYQTISKVELAATCYIEAKEYDRAAVIYLEKCGEPRLEDAGDCYSLAGCWSIAADIYSRGNCFSKCLSACAKGKLFDKGLNFIKYWRESINPDVDTVKSQELKKVEHGYLERCAIHYRELKDTNKMMKFVRAFNFMDLRRSFLRSWDCLDELVSLELESGNYIEAASVARLKGDALLEADILEQAGHPEYASRIILLYVLVNYLWAARRTPFKEFTDRKEHMTEANLMVKNEPDLCYELACIESSLLDEDSGLSQIGDSLTASQRLKNIQAEIISSRKILVSYLGKPNTKYGWEDKEVLNPMKHAELAVSSKVSPDTLIYILKLWKEKIVNLLKFLGSIGRMHESDILSVFKQKRSHSAIYALLNTHTYWRKEIDDLHGNTDLFSMDVHQFASAARSYCVSELHEVGKHVLDKLKTLHVFSVKSGFSVFRQVKIYLHIFEVAKWLTGSNILNKEHLAALWKYLSYLREQLVEMFCPMEGKLVMMERMTALRENERSKSLLKEAIVSSGSSKGRLSHGQIGAVVTLIFVSGNLSDELYEVVTDRFELNPQWNLFLEQLKVYINSGLVQESLFFVFQKALENTFLANWKEEFDYISPHCFVYLLERLLFMLSSCQKSFFTTRSSLMEMLSCENWKCKSKTTNPDIDLLVSFGRFHEFKVRVVKEILLSSKSTSEWLEKTDFAKENYPLLVLRLIILLSLVCLNSGQHFDSLYNLLDRPDIASQLPFAFCEILSRREQKFEKLLSVALGNIENPLVNLSSGNNYQENLCLDTVAIDMDVIRCSKDISGILFQKSDKERSVSTICELFKKLNIGSCD